MKKTYETPTIEIVALQEEDIITTSGLGGHRAGDKDVLWNEFWKDKMGL